MTTPALPDDPTGLRMDVFADDDPSAVVPTGVGDLALLVDGWMESRSPEGGRGAHLAIRQARQADAAPLVVHVSQVPALVATLAEVSLRLTQLWERDGRAYWAGQPAPGGTGPQDPGPHTAEPRPTPESEAERDEARRVRRRLKAEVMERVHARAPEVLATFLEAEDDDQVASALAPLLDVPLEMATDIARHLQFRELTRAARSAHSAPRA
ncbi:hypothetical protein [uncultured Modestobacter sp.]|uniref:hypothetical protein n=1 Tax=uncultured Modestobacter sp. TaxID=380048 RepID=UPI0026253E5E|nr:hypothetical protein [uncultured Modestobacter sp.]